MFEVFVSLPRIDTGGSQPRLYCVSVEVCSTVDVSIQLRAHVSCRPPHAHPVMSYILCESAEMPHL